MPLYRCCRELKSALLRELHLAAGFSHCGSTDTCFQVLGGSAILSCHMINPLPHSCDVSAAGGSNDIS